MSDLARPVQHQHPHDLGADLGLELLNVLADDILQALHRGRVLVHQVDQDVHDGHPQLREVLLLLHSQRVVDGDLLLPE